MLRHESEGHQMDSYYRFETYRECDQRQHQWRCEHAFLQRQESKHRDLPNQKARTQNLDEIQKQNTSGIDAIIHFWIVNVRKLVREERSHDCKTQHEYEAH